jgi:hypothetical protein
VAPDNATLPTPWLMLTAVASVVFQVSVADWPDSIAVGEADSVTVGNSVTVTVAEAVTEPVVLVAVRV